MENNELQHHGVLGMKWGRRKIGPVGSTALKGTASLHKGLAKVNSKAANASKRDAESIRSQRKQMLALTKNGKPLFSEKDIDNMIKSYESKGNKSASKAKNHETYAKQLSKNKSSDPALKANVKAYSKEFNKAESMSNKADKQFAGAKEQYKALGKNKIERFLKAAKGDSPEAKKYLDTFEKASKASDIADVQWKKAKEVYATTGKNRASRILNNIKYN